MAALWLFNGVMAAAAISISAQLGWRSNNGGLAAVNGGWPRSMALRHPVSWLMAKVM